jgi:hypothetical protein
MRLTIRNEWSDGSVHETKENIEASRGKYLMSSMKSYPRKYEDIPNGFRYRTYRGLNGSKHDCVTTVTLERGWFDN